MFPSCLSAWWKWLNRFRYGPQEHTWNVGRREQRGLLPPPADESQHEQDSIGDGKQNRQAAETTTHPSRQLQQETISATAHIFQLSRVHHPPKHRSAWLSGIRPTRWGFWFMILSLRGATLHSSDEKRHDSQFKMETFFVYSRVLRKERERQRPTVQVAARQSPPSDTPPRTSPPSDPRRFLHLASVCQNPDR